MDFQVIASDSGVPALSATATVFVTMFNSTQVTPSFTQSQYSFTVVEGQPSGTSVGHVELTGTQMSGIGLLSENAHFRVVSDSGEILTSEILDRELGDVYHFTVGMVGESSVSAAVRVEVLDVNDEIPRFLENFPSVVHVTEDQPPGTSVIRITASDGDKGENGSVTYHFVSGKNLRFVSNGFRFRFGVCV